MKKPISKADIREDLEAQMNSFLRDGGSVQEIPQGLSGHHDNTPPSYMNRGLFVEPRESRTLVPDVVAAIEARRKTKSARKPSTRRKRPTSRQKTIYDDFGEPLRRVWSDD